MIRDSSRRSLFGWSICLLLAFLSLASTAVYGQGTSSGTVVGVIMDQQGAVIPDATITVTDVSTKITRSTTSNNDGQYVLVNVDPGTYSISATHAGFSVARIASQAVSVGTQTTANFKLAIGGAETTIEVQASNADLQTMNSTIGVTVNPLEIDSLPSVARDVSTFATLQPGVTPGGSVAGTVADQAVFQLDGGNNSSDMDGSMQSYTGAFGGNSTGTSIGAGASGVMPMPQDSIEEFKVATAGQTADFNNSSGSQVQVVTKRGTNQVHGTAYEYYLDSNFGANTWQNNLAGTPRPSNHYNRFGGAAGGPIAPNYFGGKTYLFANYEGFRFPNSATYERVVPSAAFVAGNITLSGTAYTAAQITAADPRHIGVDPTVQAYFRKFLPQQGTAYTGGAFDTSGSGCGPLLNGTTCDGINTVAYKSTVLLPQTSNFGVVRLDHDFGSKWHFNASYRYFKIINLTANQVDIGGVFAGDTLGKATAVAPRPQDPWYLVAGLTTNISSTFTNDFHYSYLRNVWSWGDQGAAPQVTGLGGALEPFGEGTVSGNAAAGYTNASLVPANVNTQSIRTRFWDGHDHFLRDDLTKLKGNHLIQFGGQYQHNFAYHQRTDNGSGINYYTTYQLGESGGVAGVNTFPGLSAAGVSASSATNQRILDAFLGIVTDSQVAYTRSGNSLTLNAPLTPAEDKSTIPFYNLYASDTWHILSNLTVNYGLGWALEMPPKEATGKQVTLVDASDEPIQTFDYLKQRQTAALQGAVYNPQVGFALVGNVGSGQKYPFAPFYASFSPRLSAAWNPNFQNEALRRIFGDGSTVIRGGYGRVYGRLNGVGLVLTPLLGPGLIQAVDCKTSLSNGSCGSAAATDTNAFRIGVDGQSAPLQTATQQLAQPFFPGYNGSASTAASVLDPHFRPNDVDSFNLTIQRQITRKTLVEVGYIGRIIHHEYQPININTVPYMMSVGGQSFVSAYAALETAYGCATSAGLCSYNTTAATKGVGSPATKIYPNVSPQPFFESAVNPAYCVGYANCTTAVLRKEASNLGQQKVFALWTDLDNGAFNFARSLMGTPIPGQTLGANGQVTSGVQLTTASGYGNYNGGFVSFKATDFHGLTLQENFTYSKALGINATAQSSSGGTTNDAFDLRKSYGVQPFNQKFIFNTFLVYQTPWFKRQSSLLGRVAGGWTIAPILTAGSGQPLTCTTNSGSQSFGSADASGFSDNEQCVFTTPFKGGSHTHGKVTGGVDPNNPLTTATSGIATSVAGSGNSAINLFADPVAVWGTVRPPILGIDEHDSGTGPIPGLPYWNIDASIRKNVKIWERTNLEFSGILTNVFNHNVFSNPTLSLQSPTSFGVVKAQNNTPRQVEMGLRASF